MGDIYTSFTNRLFLIQQKTSLLLKTAILQHMIDSVLYTVSIAEWVGVSHQQIKTYFLLNCFAILSAVEMTMTS